MNENTYILVQGPFENNPDFRIGGVSDEDQFKIIDSWVPYKSQLIVSSWHDTNTKYLNYMNERGITNILSPYPSEPGYGNSRYQSATVLAGIQYLKEKEVKYVFKSRTNLLFSDYGKLISSIQKNNKKNKLSGLVYDSWIEGGFVIDEILYGKIEDVELFYQPLDLQQHTERGFNLNYLNRRSLNIDLTWDNIENHFYFFMNDCLKENIQINSLKKYHQTPAGKDYISYHNNSEINSESQWNWFKPQNIQSCNNPKIRYLW